MINLEDANTDNERLTLKIFKAMEDGTTLEAVEALCTDDFVWANSGLRSLEGKKDVFDTFAKGGFAQEIPILKTMTSFSADLIHIASNGKCRVYRAGRSPLGCRRP